MEKKIEGRRTDEGKKNRSKKRSEILEKVREKISS